MSLLRIGKVAGLCGAVALAAWSGDRLGVRPAFVKTTAALPVEHRPVALLAAGAERADIPRPAAIANAIVVNVDVAPADEPEIATATVATVPQHEPKLFVEAAPTDSSPLPEPEPPLVQLASADASDLLPMPAPELSLGQVASANPSDAPPIDIKPAIALIELPDECLDACIDRYLWALYERTRKEDTMKVHERRKVAVKRKGKMVMVTRSFTRLVNQDFTWKDPHAAEKVGMPMMDYVIGGMDRSFRTKLFHTLRAAEQAGLSPGITSAFRDNYRQSIASGMKAASDRSYHGGSLRGGYGHGLAADVVSVDGATRAQRWVSTEKFWKWIDAHGKEFGIGRPYLGRDPPHVAPVDGREYAAHNPRMRVHAQADIKKRTRLAMRAGPAKTLKKRNPVQASSPVRDTKQGAVSDHPKMAMAEPGRG